MNEKFGVGADRNNRKKVSHIYKIDKNGQYGDPLCKRGWRTGVIVILSSGEIKERMESARYA